MRKKGKVKNIELFDVYGNCKWSRRSLIVKSNIRLMAAWDIVADDYYKERFNFLRVVNHSKLLISELN